MNCSIAVTTSDPHRTSSATRSGTLATTARTRRNPTCSSPRGVSATGCPTVSASSVITGQPVSATPTKATSQVHIHRTATIPQDRCRIGPTATKRQPPGWPTILLPNSCRKSYESPLRAPSARVRRARQLPAVASCSATPVNTAAVTRRCRDPSVAPAAYRYAAGDGVGPPPRVTRSQAVFRRPRSATRDGAPASGTVIRRGPP